MKRAPSLIQLIFKDLLVEKRLLLLLILFLLLSSLMVIWQAQTSRDMNAQFARLSQQNDALDAEWRRLRLEHRALTEHSRIEQLARQKLNMIPVSNVQETVVR